MYLKAHWKKFSPVIVAVLLYYLFKWRHNVLYPKFEIGFRQISKKADVIGPWGIKHRNIAVYASRGQRPYMEDRFNFIDEQATGENEFSAFGVFDGHGGSFFSSYAERHLLRAIRRRILRAPTTGMLNVTQVLIDVFNEIDEEGIKDAGPGWGMCGSTAVVGVLYKHKLYLANIGNSRAAAKKRNDGAIIETVDHNPNMPGERERIEEKDGSVEYNGAWRVVGVLAMSRAFGDQEFKKRGWLISTPSITVINMHKTPIEFVILATDGLWDTMCTRDAMDFIHRHLHEHYFGAKKLAREALRRATTDNVCVMVVKFPDREEQERMDTFQ